MIDNEWLRLCVEMPEMAAETLDKYKKTLLAIYTMDCLTREGEKPVHELMKEMAKEALNDELENPNQLKIEFEKVAEGRK